MPSLKRVLDAHTSKPTLSTIIRRHTVRREHEVRRLARLRLIRSILQEVPSGHDNAR